ncbi:MAG: GNAT family N-acetyltransferase [Planctomycetota bacterium]|nr:GNAT family N-acetyltransferase [Planctomycetota bacterium]
MKPADQLKFGPIEAKLRDGKVATIRPLRTDDGPALTEFYASVPREDFRFYCPHELDRAHAEAHCAAADSPHEVVVVLVEPESPGKVIAGYAWFRWPDDEAKASTFGICVRRGWQDCGAGRALITRVREIARILGPAVMDLTVQKANPRAVALYQKMGFKIVRSQMRGNYMGFEPEPEFAMEMRTRDVEG